MGASGNSLATSLKLMSHSRKPWRIPPGAIAKVLGQESISAVNTDYITFVRQEEVLL
jgi:hypothetical protein